MTTTQELLKEANSEILRLVKCLQVVRQKLTLFDFAADPKKEIKTIISVINKDLGRL